MLRDRMQSQRFELKYIINEEKALMARDFVRSYLEMDEFSVGRPNFSYPVHSLYLDSGNLKTYWATINGDKNRYKLRLRFYSTNSDSPVFFEIKRRVNNCIMKQRGGVRQGAVRMLLTGQHPEMEHLVSKAPKQLVAVQRFVQLAAEIGAGPKVHIAYEREAYVSDNDEVRVTIDRHVNAQPNLDYSITTKMEDPHPSFVGQVILELKFTNRFPDWFKELVRVFGTMQCGAAKYVESIQACGGKQLRSTYAVISEPSDFTRSW